MKCDVTAEFLCNHFNNDLAIRFGVDHKFEIKDKTTIQLINELEKFIDSDKADQLGIESFSWLGGVDSLVRTDIWKARMKGCLNDNLHD